MKKQHHKAQITIFVIIGIILLVVAGFYLYYNQQNAQIELIDENEHELEVKIKDYMKTCTENVAQTYFAQAAKQGGYLEGIPSNSILHEGSYFVVSYDSFGQQGLATNTALAQELATLLEEDIGACLAGIIENDQSLAQYTIDVFVGEFAGDAAEETIILTYDYEFVIDGERFVGTTSQIIRAKIFNLLKRANDFTQEVLVSYVSPDIVLNMQVCQALSLSQGVKPNYPVDFLKTLSPQEEAKVIFRPDYFIVTITQDQYSFPFAVKPPLVGSIC